MIKDDKTQQQEETGLSEPQRPFNPLSKYASYTYNLALYIVTPEAYNAYVISNKKILDKGKGVAIIAQSGGVNSRGPKVEPNSGKIQQDPKRAKGFEFDYYIDDVKLTAAVSPDSNQTSTVTYDIEFKIIETAGFKFVSNLKTALENLKNESKILQQSTVVNPTRLIFILGIRFTGYDIQGNVIPVTDETVSIFSEKFYDMFFTEIKFKIDGTVTTYNIKAVITTSVLLGIQYGVINKGAFNLSGKTVGDLLRKLMAKVTEDGRLSKEKSETPNAYNRYSVKFIGNGVEKIENALLANPYDKDKSQNTGNTPGVNNSQKVNTASELKSNFNPLEKEKKFNTGTIIVKAIEDVIKQSSYVSEPLTEVYKNQVSPGENSVQKQKNNRPFQWFNVQPQIIGEPQWDNKLSSWYYNIEYQIQPYLIAEMSTGYVDSLTPYYGPVKKYEYYYSGQNSEILRYEQTLDNTYFTVVLDANGVTPRSTGGGSNTPVSTSGVTGGNNSGTSNPENYAAQNSAITYLMDPVKQARAKIDIIGDPDWLGIDNISLGTYNNNDGTTINFTSGQVFIEIGFNEPVDYDHSVGTMTLNNQILFWNYSPEIVKKYKLDNRVSYRVIQVINYFKGGKFTQTLDLIINTFVDTTAVLPANPAPENMESNTDKGSIIGWRQDPAPNIYAQVGPTSGAVNASLVQSAKDDQYT